jgi:1-acyl-sn-glycerol-3-phosphate acyltransferase
MFSFSYKNFEAILKAFPFCPLPKAIGLENIPQGEPVLYVYNHVTRRAEPLFLALAAPASPPIRFLAEITVLGTYLLPRTRADIIDSLFRPAFQIKARRNFLSRFLYEKFIDLLTCYFTTQMSRFNIIPVHIHSPLSEEDKTAKHRINRQALKECIFSLERSTPVAIAPSGGSTYEAAEDLTTQTIVPMLASLLARRGKTIKIIPCVVKERPEVGKQTYKKYVMDRILIYRLLRLLWSKLGLKSYQRPRLTVELLQPLTFPKPYPTKAEKLQFVSELQQAIYSALARD